jgi:hypothetical protein
MRERTTPLPAITAAMALALVLSACGAQTEPDTSSAPAADEETRMHQARETCHEALLATLENPDSAKLMAKGDWPVEPQPDDTLLVRPSGKTHNALGETIDAAWECVVLPDGAGMRLVTLTLVDL